ncbi:hypothetical protein [Virgibacillus halodenitrificans]|uniref:hypothetical protein n=1 Tax=Virgibacillus halodenitrificans TaxID=1482 RepID=UPI00045CB3C0|nr:hypothetical protein [Virgibacillus halodenitrificans]CDQ32508.1 hypothetical protein BN993_01924 [Virgibacillus halodenitrificans]
MKPGNDYFKESIRTLSKVKGVPPRKTRFTKNDNFITISIKNNAENGLDINCFKVIDLIYSLIGPTKTKFPHTTFTFPNTEKVDKINITFEEKEYENLLNTLWSNKEI